MKLLNCSLKWIQMNPMKSKYHSDLKSTSIHLKKHEISYHSFFSLNSYFLLTSSSEFYPNIYAWQSFTDRSFKWLMQGWPPFPRPPVLHSFPPYPFQEVASQTVFRPGVLVISLLCTPKSQPVPRPPRPAPWRQGPRPDRWQGVRNGKGSHGSDGALCLKHWWTTSSALRLPWINYIHVSPGQTLGE